MENTLEFPDLLRLIDQRSTAFRAAVASAPSLDVQVPTCPDWTLRDLVRHIGRGRRRWAAVVAAGPSPVDPAPPAAVGASDQDREPEGREPQDQEPDGHDRDIVDAWLAASTQRLLDALQEAGPDQGCWTWWDTSQSPQTCGAVARHQLQEVAVHTYDAQLTVGAAQPLPDEVALDGVEEFLVTCCATTIAWPHTPAVVDYHVTEGRSWRVWLSADGARVVRLPTPDHIPDADRGTLDDQVPDFAIGTAYASARGTAAELVLWFYGRTPVDSLALDGDRRVFDQLFAWDPEE